MILPASRTQPTRNTTPCTTTTSPQRQQNNCTAFAQARRRDLAGDKPVRSHHVDHWRDSSESVNDTLHGIMPQPQSNARHTYDSRAVVGPPPTASGSMIAVGRLSMPCVASRGGSGGELNSSRLRQFGSGNFQPTSTITPTFRKQTTNRGLGKFIEVQDIQSTAGGTRGALRRRQRATAHRSHATSIQTPPYTTQHNGS